MRKAIPFILLFYGHLYGNDIEEDNILKKNTSVLPSSKFYIGIGISKDKVQSFTYGPDTSYSTALKVGYNFNECLSVEARLVRGIHDVDQLEHDYSYGLYIRPRYQITDTLEIYALFGYSKTKISFTDEKSYSDVYNTYTTQKSFSIGAGIDYKINKEWAIYLDYIHFIDKTTTQPEGKYAIHVDAITFGAEYNF